jgi:hypothetical protein
MAGGRLIGASNDPTKRGISTISEPGNQTGAAVRVDFGLAGMVSERVAPARKFEPGIAERL